MQVFQVSAILSSAFSSTKINFKYIWVFQVFQVSSGHPDGGNCPTGGYSKISITEEKLP